MLGFCYDFRVKEEDSPAGEKRKYIVERQENKHLYISILFPIVRDLHASASSYNLHE